MIVLWKLTENHGCALRPSSTSRENGSFRCDAILDDVDCENSRNTGENHKSCRPNKSAGDRDLTIRNVFGFAAHAPAQDIQVVNCSSRMAVVLLNAFKQNLYPFT